MASKSDFTVDEWDLIRRVPLLAGMVVMVASPSGPIGIFKESAAASQMLREGLASADTELMQVLAEDLKSHWSIEQISEDPGEVRNIGLAACREVSTLLRNKANEAEAIEYKAWLVAIARRVASAAREGGFLGFGGVDVTEAELSAIDQIEVALR